MCTIRSFNGVRATVAKGARFFCDSCAGAARASATVAWKRPPLPTVAHSLAPGPPSGSKMRNCRKTAPPKGRPPLPGRKIQFSITFLIEATIATDRIFFPKFQPAAWQPQPAADKRATVAKGGSFFATVAQSPPARPQLSSENCLRRRQLRIRSLPCGPSGSKMRNCRKTDAPKGRPPLPGRKDRFSTTFLIEATIATERLFFSNSGMQRLSFEAFWV